MRDKRAVLSLWLDEAALAGGDQGPALAGETRADLCIVRGGYLSLWTALRLKERAPSLDIAIVEKGRCGD